MVASITGTCCQSKQKPFRSKSFPVPLDRLLQRQSRIVTSKRSKRVSDEKAPKLATTGSSFLGLSLCLSGSTLLRAPRNLVCSLKQLNRFPGQSTDELIVKIQRMQFPRRP